jgi:hypothetical protein
MKNNITLTIFYQASASQKPFKKDRFLGSCRLSCPDKKSSKNRRFKTSRYPFHRFLQSPEPSLSPLAVWCKKRENLQLLTAAQEAWGELPDSCVICPARCISGMNRKRSSF